MLRDRVEDHFFRDGGKAEQTLVAPQALERVLAGVAHATQGLPGPVETFVTNALGQRAIADVTHGDVAIVR